MAGKKSKQLAKRFVREFSLKIMQDICNFQDSMERINQLAEGIVINRRTGEEERVPYNIQAGAMFKYQDYMFQLLDKYNIADKDEEEDLMSLSDEELKEKIEELEGEESIKTIEPGKTILINPDTEEI